MNDSGRTDGEQIDSAPGVERVGGLAGVAFVVLFLAAAFIGGSELGGPD